MQAYSDPLRIEDLYALPDLEVFYMNREDIDNCEFFEDEKPEPGYFYWYCFPGCLPDSGPIGPFASEDEALADAQDQDW